MNSQSPSMDDVLQYVKAAKDGEKGCTQAIFYFLYKKILVNRMAIMENDPEKGRAGRDHVEKQIVELNKMLMECMAHATA
ncbi:MAG: hypothetical protein LIQ31_12600 [Planctomycetes bacterium]|nr:hypothetical protein [Planctomycetota bacterium]